MPQRTCRCLSFISVFVGLYRFCSAMLPVEFVTLSVPIYDELLKISEMLCSMCLLHLGTIKKVGQICQSCCMMLIHVVCPFNQRYYPKSKERRRIWLRHLWGSDGETSIDTMLINAHGISSKHIKTHQNHESESRSCMENNGYCST